VARIMINCPQTGQAVSTGMAADKACWVKLPDDWTGNPFPCEVCRSMHTWRRRDAYLERPRVRTALRSLQPR
jgi:hypothetical protein